MKEMKDKDTTLQCVSLGCQPIIRCYIGRIRPDLASKAVLFSLNGEMIQSQRVECEEIIGSGRDHGNYVNLCR